MHSAPPPPAVRFLAVARVWDRVIIASFRHETSTKSLQDQHALVVKVLSSERATQNHPRLTVTDREHGSLHYDSDREYYYLMITTHEYPQRVAFKCLAELRERFIAAHGEAAQKAATESLSKSARPLLRDTCDKFKDPDSFDRVLSCTKEVDEVRGILHGTVGQLLSNQDNLEVLEDKAEDLRTGGQVFQKRSTRLKTDVRWRSRKMNLAGCCLSMLALAAMLAPFAIEYWPELFRCIQFIECDFSRSNSSKRDMHDLCVNSSNWTNWTNGTNISYELDELRAALSLDELLEELHINTTGLNMTNLTIVCGNWSNATVEEVSNSIFNLWGLLPSGLLPPGLLPSG